MSKTLLICDIDGTLSVMPPDMWKAYKARDWKAYYAGRFELEEPIEETVDLVRMIRETGLFEIVFLTGRSERARLRTQQWLDANGLGGIKLVMRGDTDERPDTIIKAEWVAERLKACGSEKPRVLVFEDRPSCVQMWAAFGFTVMHVVDSRTGGGRMKP